jgi:hypothetical protein
MNTTSAIPISQIATAFLILNFLVKHGCSIAPTKSFTTKSGLPVSRYGLGGAARSTQPSSLPSLYFNELKNNKKETEKVEGAPFYFYYNPHRYPDFMSGVKHVCSTHSRDNIFVASGGTDRSYVGLDERLSDCLEYCGGEYLDLFILEYIVPEELDSDSNGDNLKLGEELTNALKHTQQWLKNGSVRYIGISTHSHVVGEILSHSSAVDILMLRYGMSHKDAAENISFPAAKKNDKPVIAFTSTRWNSLQDGISDDQWDQGAIDATDATDAFVPTSADCLSFVFNAKFSPPVEAVLHSARDEDELLESMSGLRTLSEVEEMKWREYGNIFEVSNNDSFDEYPEERENI